MTLSSRALFSIAVAGIALSAAVPASALTMQECSAKYEAAKADGTAGGKKWNDFRKAQCGAGAPATTTAAAPPVPTIAPVPQPATEPKAAEAKPAPNTASAPKPARSAASAPAAPVGTATFPSKVDPKYASETEGKQRMHTCLDSYKANKAAGMLGGMKWIAAGTAGFYSQCNTRLKG